MTLEHPAPARSLDELTVAQGSVDVVALGASAGGVEALSAVVASLPSTVDCAVLVVLHVSESGTSVMPEILSRAGPLPAANAIDGEPLLAGRVYVAPPAHHLTIEGGRARVDQGPRENGHRPAIDPLLRTLGDAFGPRAAGVILSGARDDGTAGLYSLKRCGGVALVQDPGTALYPSMPTSAVEHVEVDAILPLDQLGPAIARLAGRRRPAPGAPLAPQRQGGQSGDVENGRSSRFTCPDCGGVLFEYRDGTLQRFRCSVGHAYSFDSLVERQAHQLEAALWAAARTLEDRALLLRRMERDSRDRGHERSAGVFEAKAVAAAEQASAIRAAVEAGAAATPPSPPEEPAAPPEVRR
jgi:two-component system chemotaxis response regulator CheB